MAKSRKDHKKRALHRGEIQRKSDLMYIFTYTDMEGKRRYLYSKDLGKLREREKLVKLDQLEGVNTYVAGKSSLNYVFDRYLKTKTELRQTTYTNYLYMYDHFIREGFGKRKISEIKYSDIIMFYQSLLQEKKLQINTLETIQTLLHPTFQLAVRDGIIRSNPSERVMCEIKKKPGRNHGVRHALTLDQQRAFIRYISTNPLYIHWRPLFVVLLGTGCRIGELIGLRWEDIDLEKRLISINHSVTYYCRYKGSGDKTSISEHKVSLPKTDAGIRTIPMMGKVYDAFMEELEYQKENGFCDVELDGMTGFIFYNRFGKLHNPSALNRVIKRIYTDYNAEEIVKAAKEGRQPVLIPHFSCHHLRHTFCTRFCEHETNVKVIQSIMGHADITTTMDIYAEVSEMKKQEAIRELSNKYDIF